MANFWFDGDTIKTLIPAIVLKEMGKQYTHKPIYYMKDDWDNWHTLDRT